MESRRFLLAVVLSVAVIFGMQFLFPKAAPFGQAKVADTTTATTGATKNGTTPAASSSTTASAPGAATTANAQPAAATQSTATTRDSASVATTATAAAETTVVVTRRDSGATFKMSNVGAAPVSVTMNSYVYRAPGASGNVDLSAGGQPILRYHLVAGQSQPVDMSGIAFQGTREGNDITYRGTVGASAVAIRYAIVPDSFVAHVTGTVSGAGAGTGSYVVVDLPHTFAATEPDTADDRNALAYAFMPRHDAGRSVLFRSLDPGEKQLIEGPLTWIAAKSKYFVVGMLAPKNGPELTEATLVGGARTTKIATQASATVVVPVKNGAFAFDVYAGPQEWRRLNSQGRDFEQVNPYGYAWARGIMQPIATTVIRLVLWMHSNLKLSYGLVLIALGLLVRLIMWPLYQSSMKTSIKMQVIQPELQAVQDKYKDDPEKQRAEVMKVYQAHGMNPLSPLLGCLPSLLPMPILLSLYVVFRSTIEFRGVPFLWIHDLSAHDPYYILPLFMAGSMYLISWIGMRNTPPNPQAKMMSYVMPAMFVVFLYRAAAGLNLYYATQNIATLPQQWHLSRGRAKAAGATGATAAAVPAKGKK